MRRVSTPLALVVILLIMPAAAIAQQGADNGHGEGVTADEPTTQQALSFIDTFVALMNSQDPSVVNSATETALGPFFFADTYNEAWNNVANGTFTEIVLYEASDVRAHDDGAVSVKLTYSGYIEQYTRTVLTERWYLFPDGAGWFVMNDAAPLAPEAPAGMHGEHATVVLSNSGIVLDPDLLPAADVLLLRVQNLEQSTHLTTGIYPFPAETGLLDAQAALFADWSDDGQMQDTEFIGVTPVAQGGAWEYAFLVEPGSIYYLQQWTLDDTGQNPVPMEGEQFITTITITPEAEATPQQ